MRKNVLLSLVFVLLFVASIFTINAATARVPSEVPAEGDKLYASVDEAFDFSKITFSSEPSGATIPGKNDMKKIMLAPGINEDGSLNDLWFTAYCLNGMMKYPLFHEGILDALPDAVTPSRAINSPNMLNMYGVITLFKDSALYDLFEPFIGYYNFTVNGGNVSQDTINDFHAGKDVTVTISSIEFFKEESMGTVTSTQINDARGITGSAEYAVTFNKKDILSDIYTTIEMPKNVYYNTALWIIEHSYPNLSMEVALKDAGADYQTLVNEIKALHPEYSDAELEVAVENYVYSTVQYAIWKAEDGYTQNINGTDYKLGDTLSGSAELNKLYKYLIKDRDIYENYDSIVFDDTLEINKPKEGEEIYSESADAYMFGPYTVKSNMLSIGDATITITNSDKKGISVVDASGNGITSVRNEQKFYIKVLKSAKVGSVSLKIETKNGTKFENNDNRGRLYSPNMFVEQTVASGGKVVNAQASATLEVVVNAKTGTQDVLLILLVAFVAFTVGYLILRYKGEPLDLN